MATENRMLMQEARESLRGKWGAAIGVYVIYLVITIVIGSLDKAGSLIQLLVDGPLFVGLAIVSLAFARGQTPPVSEIFAGFHDFVRALVAYLLMVLFTLLWALLLIVPGIIAALSYSMTFFILAEDKAISAREAIKKSKALMYGHKKKLFYLTLRFFGWFLLSILTFGIGFLWFVPYLYVTMAKFYDDISKSVPQVAAVPA